MNLPGGGGGQVDLADLVLAAGSGRDLCHGGGRTPHLLHLAHPRLLLNLLGGKLGGEEAKEGHEQRENILWKNEVLGLLKEKIKEVSHGLQNHSELARSSPFIQVPNSDY